MKFLRRLTKIENFWPLLIVISFAVLAGRTLIFEKGYFVMHDDLQMMRQLEMEKCFRDWQVPCRWVPDMGYGYGFPLFNFYPPLPYLVGQVFRILQFSFIDTVKLTFALSFILSGITMYFLAKEFFGKWGGVLSSIFYIWAPYHSVDVYVRGAMNEAWALIWFPLIFLTSYKLITSRKSESVRWLISLSLVWVGLLLSHNLMVMIFTPVFAVWCFIFWIKNRNWMKFLQFLTSGVLSLALAAFFTLPALFEQKYIHVDSLTMGYYEYIAHFATIGQLLFSRFWGYGPSIWGPNDGMPFQVGHVHWILSLVILCLVIYSFWKKKKFSSLLLVVSFSIAFAWFAAFMAHQNSTFIWQRIKILTFVQFPWRFLSLVILGFSFAAGSIFVLLPKKLASYLGILLVVLLIGLNWNYFLPLGGHMGPLTDKEKFSGAAWDLQRTAGIFDYLPKSAEENPKDGQRILVEVVEGKNKISGMQEGTNWAGFETNGANSEVRVNIFDFPIWQAYVDDNKVSTFVPETEKWGRMYMSVPQGSHRVYFRLGNTPIRTAGNYISLIACAGLILFLVFGKKVIHGKMA